MAKKSKMTMKKWEGSKADEKMDRAAVKKANMKCTGKKNCPCPKCR